MPSKERESLISDIKNLMSNRTNTKQSYSSGIVNKVVDKIFVRLGIVSIIGLLLYLAIKKSSEKDKYCKC